MKVLVQRVKHASVEVDGKIVGKIEKGLLLLVGVTHDDDESKADFLAKKVCNLRIFRDEEDKMNLSVKDIDGELLIISQFTLYGDARKGNRPSFIEAAKTEQANELYEYFCEKCSEEVEIQKGIFGADMKVELLNDGPVTMLLEK
ncbi:MAG: D-tyrosyl-tRNA(Tyr) deacylase [Clostridia bacterium]|nr:D-tyrosyl-tRNA(Tyr) deacylase [Clostridia bacterium]